MCLFYNEKYTYFFSHKNLINPDKNKFSKSGLSLVDIIIYIISAKFQLIWTHSLGLNSF
jgi:hypothetical protein